MMHARRYRTSNFDTTGNITLSTPLSLLISLKTILYFKYRKQTIRVELYGGLELSNRH